MLYNLVDNYLVWLTDHGFGFLRVFTYIEFRTIAAIILSFFIVLAMGRRTIGWLVRMKIGDNPEFYNADLNELMNRKTATPTMGGILISSAILLNTIALADVASFYVQMAILCLLWLAVLGGFDDYLKLTSARRKPGSREGLFFWEKLVFQLALAVVLGLFIHKYGDTKFRIDPHQISKMTHALTLPLVKTWVYSPEQHDFVPSPNLIVLGPLAFVLLTTILITGSSNAVNLTDGMDGLASGIMGIVALAFVVLTLLAGWGDGDVAKKLLIPYIPKSEELAIVAGAMVGSCLGFLWFNCSPAQVFMGDTGSLPLGGLIGYIAVVIRQESMLFIVGGIFVLEALSVMLQVGFFKFSGGKRILRCAPIHHHFHLSGLSEEKVVVRFWLLTAIFAAIGVATIKLR